MEMYEIFKLFWSRWKCILHINDRSQFFLGSVLLKKSHFIRIVLHDYTYCPKSNLPLICSPSHHGKNEIRGTKQPCIDNFQFQWSHTHWKFSVGDIVQMETLINLPLHSLIHNKGSMNNVLMYLFFRWVNAIYNYVTVNLLLAHIWRWSQNSFLASIRRGRPVSCWWSVICSLLKDIAHYNWSWERHKICKESLG